MADAADRAQTCEELHRSIALAARARTSEPQSRDARGRIVCRDCGQKIPRRRLIIAPQACRCVECQGDHERRRA